MRMLCLFLDCSVVVFREIGAAEDEEEAAAIEEEL